MHRLLLKKTILWKRIAYGSVCVVSALIVLAIFLRSSGFNEYRRAYFSDLIYGRAYKPFVYRVLLPLSVRLVTAVLPGEFKVALNRSLGETQLIQRTWAGLGWELHYLIEYSIAVLLMYLSLIGFIFSLRYVFTGVFRAPDSFANAIPLFALLGLPPIFGTGSYIYDLTTLFLFTLGLGLMVRRKWLQYAMVFLLGCLNKETTILLTMIFLIHFFNQRRTIPFVRLLLLQLGIFIVVKLALTIAFQSNPGTIVEFHFWDHNLRLLYNLLKPYSFSTLLLGSAAMLLIFYNWSGQPSFLRHSFWIIVPLLVLTLLLGYLEELRDYYEIYPIIILLVYHNIGKMMGIPIQSRSETL